MQDGACIFCAIAAGDQPAVLVHEDEHTVAFMDINPWALGHTLVIPRRHAPNVFEIEDDDLARTYAAASQVAARMRERLDCDRVDMWNSAGAVAGQVVFHFHVHLVPHYPGAEDALQRLPRLIPDPAELAAVGDALRS